MTNDPPASPEWLRRYLEDYWTLDEVGELEGISREAANNRLEALGIKPRTASETLELREVYETSLHAEAIKSTFLQTRSIEETVEAIGLRHSWVKRFVTQQVPDFHILTREPRNTTNNYSVEDLSESLREAASLSANNLTTAAYDQFAKTYRTLKDGRPRPGKQTMLLRYGSWGAALQAAGLPANPHAGPKKGFDEADAVGAVVECWRTTGLPPTVKSYEEWHRQNKTHPSSATVRKLAGPWNALLVRAWQVVHGIVLDQEEDSVTVPEPLLRASYDSPVSNTFVTYFAANEGTEISLKSNFATGGYLALERAVRSHALIQNSVAQAGTSAGFSAWRPTPAGPTFDVALSRSEGHVFVVEVKSATRANLEFQLRIGLGQVLRYAHQLRSDAYTVLPVIAIELRPDDSWVSLLQNLGVGLLVHGSISTDLAALVQDRCGESDSISVQQETSGAMGEMPALTL